MRDMTTGEPYGHLWRYALPLLLGNWLQLAYNAVDSIIAGWTTMMLFEVPYYFITCKKQGLPREENKAV